MLRATGSLRLFDSGSVGHSSGRGWHTATSHKQLHTPPLRPNNVWNLITLTFVYGRRGCHVDGLMAQTWGDAFVSHSFLFLLLFKDFTLSSDFFLYQAYVRSSLGLERFSFCHRLLKRRPGRCCSMAMIRMALWTLRGGSVSKKAENSWVWWSEGRACFRSREMGRFKNQIQNKLEPLCTVETQVANSAINQ